MRYILSFALAAVLSLAVQAGEIAKAKSDASLALATSQREREAAAVSAEQAKACASLMLTKVQREREQVANVLTSSVRDCGCNLGGICRCNADCPCDGGLTYARAYATAAARNKRLAVFVGCKARPIEDVVTVSVPWSGEWREYRQGAIAVSRPDQASPGKLLYLGEVDPDTPDEEIRTGGRKEVQAPAPTIFTSLARRRAVADDR